MEKILEIKEVTNVKIKSQYGYNLEMFGYSITTNKQEILLLISSQDQCCERYGYFFCNEDFKEFIGADLISVGITDTSLNEGIMESNDIKRENRWWEGDVMFVNLETTIGTLQFVAYNEHNGYYGHEAVVRCNQLKHSEVL